MTLVTLDLCEALFFNILIKTACNPCCPTQDPELPLPLSASLPSKRTSVGLAFVVRPWTDGLSSVTVNWGPGRRVLIFIAPLRRSQ